MNTCKYKWVCYIWNLSIMYIQIRVSLSRLCVSSLSCILAIWNLNKSPTNQNCSSCLFSICFICIMLSLRIRVIFVVTGILTIDMILAVNVIMCLLLALLRANTSICPRLSAAIFVCAENVVKMRVFCIMANFMCISARNSIGTCASLLQIIIIIIIIIINHYQTLIEDLQWM